MYILLGALLLLVVLLGVRWFVTAEPYQLAKIARMGLVVAAGASLTLLILSGRLSVVLIGGLSLLPFLPYARRLWGESLEETNTYSPQESTKLSREQALKILGLSEDADEQQVRAAHRRLIQKIHPDKGGSGFLAAQVNQAKETLLHLMSDK